MQMRGWQSAKIHIARRRQSQITTSSAVQGIDKKKNNNNKRYTPTSYLQDSPESDHALRTFVAEYLKFLMESTAGFPRLIKLAAVLLLQSSTQDEALRADGLSLFSSLKPDFFPNHRGKASLDRVATEKKSAYGASTDRKRVKAGQGECTSVSGWGSVIVLKDPMSCSSPFHL